MFHGQHVSHKWHVFVILFYYVLPRASYGSIQCGFIPTVVWRSPIIFLLFRCRNLALNRMLSCIKGRNGGCQLRGHVYTPCTFIHPHTFICPVVHLYASISCTSAFLPISYVPHMSWALEGHMYTPYILGSFGGISTSIRHFSVYQYIHLPLS